LSFFPDLLAKPASRAVSDRRSPYLLALLVSAAYAAPAMAAISDTIHPYVSASLMHDDNLLRLDDGESVNGQRSDTYKQAVAGVTVEQPIGRQMVTADLRVSRVTFDRFSQYDYNGKDAQAQWAWQLADHLSGHLGGQYSETLAPFSDFGAGERNLRVQRKEFVDGTWQFHPRWQVRGGFTREEFRYDLSSQKYNNRDQDTSEFGVDYLTPAGSRIGVQLRHLKGSYPNGFIGNVLVSDDYTQDEAKINIYWRYSAITQIQFLGGRARREHSFFTERDQSGTNGRLLAYWAPAAKLKFTGGAWREFSAVDGAIINSALNKGVSLDGTWQATTKIGVTGQLRRERRDFGTVTAAQETLDDPHDVTRSAGLSLTYVPLPNIELTTGVSRNDRKGNFSVGTGNYKSNSASFSAKIVF
jgi:exopolysaccharide biosynthesis operon protein EpsL